MSEAENVTTNGSEKRMDIIANIFLTISLLSTIVTSVLSIEAISHNDDLGFIYLAIATVFLLQGLFVWIILKAGSEIIRILKKVSGLPYDGELTKIISKEVSFNIFKSPTKNAR